MPTTTPHIYDIETTISADQTLSEWRKSNRKPQPRKSRIARLLGL